MGMQKQWHTEKDTPITAFSYRNLSNSSFGRGGLEDCATTIEGVRYLRGLTKFTNDTQTHSRTHGLVKKKRWREGGEYAQVEQKVAPKRRSK